MLGAVVMLAGRTRFEAVVVPKQRGISRGSFIAPTTDKPQPMCDLQIPKSLELRFEYA